MFRNFTAQKFLKKVLDCEIFGPWKLKVHQKRAVNAYLKNNGKMILADDFNMGKTVTALACGHFANLKKILVIAPRALLSFWLHHLTQIASSPLVLDPKQE